MRYTPTIAAALTLFVAIGCSCTKNPAETASGRPGAVAIEVGSYKISDADIKAEMEMLPAQYKMLVATKEGKKGFVEQLVDKELFYQESVSSGIDKNPEVAAELEKVRRTLLAQRFIKSKLKGLEENIKDDALKSFYEKNKKDFASPEKVSAKHILVKDEKVASDLQGKITADPRQFEELAKKHSIDSSAKNGGDLGTLERDGLVKEFADALDKLKKEGEISPVVKTQFGYHIIKFGRRQAGEPPKFDEIKEEVREAYLRKALKESYDKIVGDLKKKYKVVEHEDVIVKVFDDKEKKDAPTGAKEAGNPKEAGK